MNDAEYATLLDRQAKARDMGYTRNDYACYGCIEQGKTFWASCYLDWPAYYDRETHRAYCSEHARAAIQSTEEVTG